MVGMAGVQTEEGWEDWMVAEVDLQQMIKKQKRGVASVVAVETPCVKCLYQVTEGEVEVAARLETAGPGVEEGLAEWAMEAGGLQCMAQHQHCVG
jgi:hypothetical protein